MPDIIIKSGSVSLMFDDKVFVKDLSNPTVYSNGAVTVRRVLIDGPDGGVDYPCKDGLIVVTIMCE